MLTRPAYQPSFQDHQCDGSIALKDPSERSPRLTQAYGGAGEMLSARRHSSEAVPARI